MVSGGVQRWWGPGGLGGPGWLESRDWRVGSRGSGVKAVGGWEVVGVQGWWG